MSIWYLENRVWFLGAKIQLQKVAEKQKADKLKRVAELEKADKPQEAQELREDAERQKAAAPDQNISIEIFEKENREHKPEAEARDKPGDELILKLKEKVRNAKVMVRPESIWTLDKQYPDALVLKFDDRTEKEIYRHVDDGQKWPMTSLRLAIHGSGLLQILSEFTIAQLDHEEVLETTTERLQESLDRLYPFLAHVVDKMHAAKVLRKSKHLHFGVPPDEPPAGQYDVFGSHSTALDAFSYNQHFILDTDDATQAAQLGERAGLAAKCTEMEIDGIHLRWGRTVRVWWGAQEKIKLGRDTILWGEKAIPWGDNSSVSENGLVRAFVVESIELSKLTVASTAQTVYVKLLLRMARQKENLKPERLRSIMDLCNGLFQHVSLYKWRLDEKQSELLQYLEEKGGVQDAVDGFRSTEANLVAATEGQESLISRRQSRIMEIILFILTVISLLSVVTDVATFVLGSDRCLHWAILIIAFAVIFFSVFAILRARRSTREQHTEQH